MSAPGVIVLAAGQGTRMRSALPKVLHPVCGKPMLLHILDAARALGPARIAVVVGHGAERVREAAAAPDVAFVEQDVLDGTGGAVDRCREAMRGCNPILVLNGDEPLVSAATLGRLLAALGEGRMAFTTQWVPDGLALGRVRREGDTSDGAVMGIVQLADDAGRSGAAEINWGKYAFSAPWLWDRLDRVPLSAKNERYLTLLADFAYEEGAPAATIAAGADEAIGVDDRVKLAEAERRMRQRLLRDHMLAGVTIADPATTYIDATVRLGQDVTVLPNSYLRGETSVGENSVIGPASTLRNATVGRDSEIAQSVVEESRIGERVHLGPFSHVRGNSTIGDDCHLGNYAEVNRSTLGRDVKMHHFSYLGDATVGDGANIAAGVITCNYDGVNKNPTVIGEGAFVACDTMLVAPVTFGAHARTGAGAVLRDDLPPGALAVGVPARIIPTAPPES